jgi:hypothetical protein
MFIKAFVAHGAIEALHEGILDGLSRLDEGQFDLVFVGPAVELLARKLRAIVQDDAHRAASLDHHPIQHAGDSGSAKRGVDLNSQALPNEVVDFSSFAALWVLKPLTATFSVFLGADHHAILPPNGHYLNAISPALSAQFISCLCLRFLPMSQCH